MGATSIKFPIKRIRPYADAIFNVLSPHFSHIELCGSLRRNEELVSDIDIVLADGDVDFKKLIRSTFGVSDVQCEFANFNSRMSYICYPDHFPLKVDIWLTKPETFGAGVLYATGPGLSNVVMRRWARYNGKELFFDGVFKDNERIAGRTEEECCEAIGWDLVEPELRFNDDRYFGKYLDIMNKDEEAHCDGGLSR